MACGLYDTHNNALCINSKINASSFSSLADYYASNMTDTLELIDSEKATVMVDRLYTDEDAYNQPVNGVVPSDIARVFAFSFSNSPQVAIYQFYCDIGIDDFA